MTSYERADGTPKTAARNGTTGTSSRANIRSDDQSIPSTIVGQFNPVVMSRKKTRNVIIINNFANKHVHAVAEKTSSLVFDKGTKEQENNQVDLSIDTVQCEKIYKGLT
eukprot:GHVT01045810.1.p1 GENE.GHVT01045810.1~~GHVT01045810.1.p1  ORF type:complete len:109 (+),score=7.25 GHVT01045810.1:1012-1338(+)